MFGLDIGSCFIKIVQFRKDELGYIATAAARTNIHRTGEDDTEQGKNNIVAAIVKSRKSAHIRTKYAVCGVCGQDVAVRSFNLRSLPSAELIHAMTLEAEQVCPFDVDQCVVDYQVISNAPQNGLSPVRQSVAGNDRIHGIFAAATNDIIARKRRLVKEASLTCVFVDVDSLALSNCFLECEKLSSDQAIAILDIGSLSTSLVVIRRNGLPFIRDMDYAGNDVINQMASELQLSTNVVISVLCGSETASSNFDKWAVTLEKACNKLIINTNQTLRYYMVQEAVRVEKIYVCGGLAQALGVINLLDAQFPSEVLLWNPFKKIRCQTGAPGMDVLDKHGPSMAVAAGLAMRMI